MAKKRIIKKLQTKYKLSIYNEKTFEELISLKISKLKIVSSILGLIVITSIIVFLLILFTDIKQVIPGFDRNLRRKAIHNSISADSLRQELEKRDRFFASIKNIINETNGGKPTPNQQQKDTVSQKNYDIKFEKSAKEQKFRKQIEDEERFNLLIDHGKPKHENIKLFPPVLGIISQQFDATHQHYGIDIVAKPNSKISTVLDGTVIFTGWTIKTGHVIHVQHANNLISIYKHNVELLKKTGQHVKAGEAIAIIGNTGELTSSTHLHFELWKSGNPLNPELYIKFK